MAGQPKREWLVLLPDKPDSLTRRLNVRLSVRLEIPLSLNLQVKLTSEFGRKHLNGVHDLHNAGFWAMSGAYMSSTPKDNEILSMIGSAMIALANTKEEILDVLNRDVYAQEGVWDLERVQIWPFRSTVRAKL